MRERGKEREREEQLIILTFTRNVEQFLGQLHTDPDFQPPKKKKNRWGKSLSVKKKQ